MVCYLCLLSIMFLHFYTERGYSMAQEAVNIIKETEEKARKIISDADNKALEIISDANKFSKDTKETLTANMKNKFIDAISSAEKEAQNLMDENQKHAERSSQALYEKYMSDEASAIRQVIEYILAD